MGKKIRIERDSLEELSVPEDAYYGVQTVRARCIDGVEADIETWREYAEKSLGLALALTPTLGYAMASEVAKEAREKGISLVEVVQEKGLLSPEELEEILDAARMTEPGIRKAKKNSL